MLLHPVGRKHRALRAARKPHRHEREHEAVGKTVGKLHRATLPPQQDENTPEMADSTKNGATMPIR